MEHPDQGQVPAAASDGALTLDIYTKRDHDQPVKSPQTWFNPLTNSTNGIYTFDN